MKQDEAEIEIYEIASDNAFYNYFYFIFKYENKY